MESYPWSPWIKTQGVKKTLVWTPWNIFKQHIKTLPFKTNAYEWKTHCLDHCQLLLFIKTERENERIEFLDFLFQNLRTYSFKFAKLNLVSKLHLVSLCELLLRATKKLRFYQKKRKNVSRTEQSTLLVSHSPPVFRKVPLGCPWPTRGGDWRETSPRRRRGRRPVCSACVGEAEWTALWRSWDDHPPWGWKSKTTGTVKPGNYDHRRDWE